MKIYPPVDGFTAEEMKRGLWVLHADVKCQDCDKEYAASQVGGIGGPCPKCGGRCV